MGAKRALIVDDSKSARSFLARILEKYEMEVDSAENAEQAIEYLEKARPDVIFMDHLMPGMDGFQAVQSIKNNPRTATIPILMYTSQEGELYLGQARALGALGVLPKQIKPADVSKVLYQLRLLPDRRRSTDRSAFVPGNAMAMAVTGQADDLAPTLIAPSPLVAGARTPADGADSIVAAAAETADTRGNETVAMPVLAATHTPAPPPTLHEQRQMFESMLRAELADLRSSLNATLDLQSERLLGDVRAAVVDLVPAAPAPAPVPPEPARAPVLPWAIAAGASLVAAVLALLWWQQASSHRALAEQLVLARAAIPGTPASSPAGDPTPATSAAPDAAVAPVDAQPSTRSADERAGAGSGAATPVSLAQRGAREIVQPVPYGEVPISGERLDSLRALLNELAEQQFRGTVTVSSYPGRFCLKGSATEGYSLAPPATLLGACDVLGNPFDESLTSVQREPLALANLLGPLRRQSGGGLEVSLATGSEARRVAGYPDEAPSTTAGEWNRAAAANNRLEVRITPRAN